MFLRISLISLILGLTTPVIVNAQPAHSLIIHSDENRKYCNDGYTWDATDKMCLADPGR